MLAVPCSQCSGPDFPGFQHIACTSLLALRTPSCLKPATVHTVVYQVSTLSTHAVSLNLAAAAVVAYLQQRTKRVTSPIRQTAPESLVSQSNYVEHLSRSQLLHLRPGLVERGPVWACPTSRSLFLCLKLVSLILTTVLVDE